MYSSVWIIVILLLAIGALMGWRLRGKSLGTLFGEAEREHHRVHAVIARHPDGGTWREYTRWLDEVDRTGPAAR